MTKVTKLQKDMLQLIWDHHDEMPIDFWTKYAKRVADNLRRKDLAAPYWNDEKRGYFWQLTEKGREVIGVEGIVCDYDDSDARYDAYINQREREHYASPEYGTDDR